MQHYIEICDEKGHVSKVPLWQLPGLVKENVDCAREKIKALKDEKAAREAAEKRFAEEKVAAEIKAAAALDTPYDLTDAVEV